MLLITLSCEVQSVTGVAFKTKSRPCLLSDNIPASHVFVQQLGTFCAQRALVANPILFGLSHRFQLCMCVVSIHALE